MQDKTYIVIFDRPEGQHNIKVEAETKRQAITEARREAKRIGHPIPKGTPVLAVA